LTSFTNLILPVRWHLCALVPVLGSCSQILCSILVGSPFPQDLIWNWSTLGLAMIMVIYGSYRHEKGERDRFLAEKAVQRLTRLSKGLDIDAYAAEEMSSRNSLEAEILKKLPNKPRICILGGTTFQDPSSEMLVEALAAKFTDRLSGHVVVMTGGMPGVQKAFAQSLGSSFGTQVHLLPKGQSSNFGVGVDLTAGEDLPERMTIFGNLGHIYLSIEGGPGVAKEARAAFSRGAVVLPMMSTGGASAGMFDYPPGALQQPAFFTKDQWGTMKSKEDPKAIAAAVVEAIVCFLSQWKEDPDHAMANFQRRAVEAKKEARASISI